MMPPSKDEADAKWFEYQRACNKLSEMRNEQSASTELDIQIQLQLTEKLLQEWMDSVDYFRASLN